MFDKKPTIGVVGLGKLGLPLACLFAKSYKIIGVDISQEIIKAINRNATTFEPYVNEYLRQYGKNLKVTTDYSALKRCSVIFVIVQTPSLENGKFDTKYVEDALVKLHNVNPRCLAVISSTINIGDMLRFRKLHDRLVYNPEFIKQGSILKDFLAVKFLLVGAFFKEDGLKVAEIWTTVWQNHYQNTEIVKKVPVQIIDATEAEIVKLCSNVSYTLGITYANVIGELCEKYNWVDNDGGVHSPRPNTILDIIYKDRRDYHKGLGFAGPCFKRDVNSFLYSANTVGAGSGKILGEMLNAANAYTVQEQVDKIKATGRKSVAILSVAYKVAVPYIYDSQALDVAKKLAEEGFEIYIYDRMAAPEAKKVLNPKNVHYVDSALEAVDKGDCVFVGVPDSDLMKLADIVAQEMKKPVINPWR